MKGKGNRTMRGPSSVQRDAERAPSAQPGGDPMRPVTLSERSLLLLALVRIFVGLLWFQQLFWKLPPDFAGLHRSIVEEGKYTFLLGYAFVIQHVFLPNFRLLGAILATVLAIQLDIGLAYAPGEWYWTYGMLVLLGLALAALPAGRRLGVDQWLALRLETQTSRVARVLRWFI